tara:strand:- start:1280 stop:1690 length:411 start_codon:yes stop_codon:yes gene_type:complete
MKLILRGVFAGIPLKFQTTRPEDAICSEFAYKLREMQLSGEVKKDFAWTHVANESNGKVSYQAEMAEKALGKVAGWPDHMFVWSTGSFGIEFKTPKGVQSPKQKAVQAWFDKCGIPYYICRSSKEAFVALKSQGLI